MPGSRTWRSLLSGTCLALVALGVLAGSAGAATIQVTTSGDENGTNPAACSLREAVQAANLNVAVGGCQAGDSTVKDRIVFGPGTNGSAFLLSAGTMGVTSDVEIIGNGASQTIIDGGGTVQPLLVAVGAIATLQDLAIVNGRAINGGAISNSGMLVVVNSTLSSHSATLGGAILNASGGTLSLSASTVSGNSATNGGAIHNAGGGTVSVTSSTISGNAATIGGAIYNDAAGSVSLVATTLSGNTATSTAGGIFNFSTGTVTMRATLLDTGSTGANCAGAIESLGGNMADDATCFAHGGANQVATNLRLGALADNGGPTKTHALPANSPAIDAVEGSCTSDGSDLGPLITADQRGALRPRLGRGSGPARCDVGAFEMLSSGELRFSDRAFQVAEDARVAVITIVRSGGDSGAVSATVTLGGGTAVPSEDYSGATFLVIFEDGESSKSVAIPIIDDALGEPDETVTLTLADPTDGVRVEAPSTAVLTIADNDPTPTLSIDDVRQVEGDVGATAFVFTVTLAPASGQPVTVIAQTVDDQARSPEDFAAIGATTLTFPPTVTSQTFTVQVAGDAVNEPDETFAVTLSRPRNATISDDRGIGTIVNDDEAPVLSIDDVNMPEGTGGATNFVFTVSLSAPTSVPVSVDATIEGGSAAAPGDFNATGVASIRFAPGQTSRTVSVPVIGDAISEPSETFTVTLGNPVNATISRAVGIGTIADDDGVPIISIGSASTVEGNAGTVNLVFTLSLSPASDQTVTVLVQTADGSATAGVDYIALPLSTVTFGPLATTQTVTVGVVGDAFEEPNENFAVNLTDATNASIGVAQGVGTIMNDDQLPTLSIGDVSLGEGNSGTTNFVFTVSLNAPSTLEVTVQVQTADGNATAGTDYTGLPLTTLTFAPGATTQTVTVAVTADTVPESIENFAVNLSGAVNATIADPQGVGTIYDDDPVPAAR